jgi:hypothetical protein
VEYLTGDPAEPAARNPVADVRDVPLEQLADDAEGQELVSAARTKMTGPARVAMFNSAI